MKRMLWQVVALGLVASVSAGCWPLAVGGAALGGYYIGKDDRTAVQIADDAAVTASVKAKYIRDPLVSALDVNVDTYQGIVTIYGTLPDRNSERRAIALAEETRGVQRVVSRLTVASDYTYDDGGQYGAYDTPDRGGVMTYEERGYGTQQQQGYGGGHSHGGAGYDPGYGAQSAPSYQNQSYGAPAAQPGYDNSGYGAPAQPNYGAPARPNYGAQNGQGYGNGGYGTGYERGYGDPGPGAANDAAPADPQAAPGALASSRVANGYTGGYGSASPSTRATPAPPNFSTGGYGSGNGYAAGDAYGQERPALESAPGGWAAGY